MMYEVEEVLAELHNDLSLDLDSGKPRYDEEMHCYIIKSEIHKDAWLAVSYELIEDMAGWGNSDAKRIVAAHEDNESSSCATDIS